MASDILITTESHGMNPESDIAYMDQPLTVAPVHIKSGCWIGEKVVIMPGVAFDCSRNRIGYGGGYYDRYLAGYDSVYKIAAAYDLQIVEQVPAEPFDLKPDCIVTESHIYAG